MRHTVGFALFLTAAVSAQAAEFLCMRQLDDHSAATIAAIEQALPTKPSPNACTAVLLTGPIVPGDASRLKQVFVESEGLLETLYLDSPGGDIREAMAIGRFLRRALITTVAPLEYQPGNRFYPRLGFSTGNPCHDLDCVCASACFVVWAAGANRSGYVLSVHRPRFEPEYFSGLDLATAQLEYGLALRSLKLYFQEMGIPDSYYDRMVNTPSTDLSVLTNEDAEKLSVDRYPPAIDEWLTSKCGAPSSEERDAELEYRMQSILNKPNAMTAEEHKVLSARIGDIERCRARTMVQTRHDIYRALSLEPDN